MSDSYKKYLEKAKKNNASKEDDKRKQEKEFKDLYKQFHLKYAMGTSDVANTSSNLSPLLKEKYSDDNQPEESQQKSYQAKEYFGKEDGDSAGPLSRMNKGGQVKHYAEGTPSVDNDNAKGFLDSIKKAFSGADAAPAPSVNTPLQDKYDRIRKENTERALGQRSALLDPSKFSDGTSDVKPTNIDQQQAQAAQDSLRKAFHFSDGGEVYQKFLKLYNGISELKNPLEGLHAPVEKKYPLNIPKIAKVTIPKRLNAVTDIKSYADGGQVEDDSAMGALSRALKKQFGTPDTGSAQAKNTDTQSSEQKRQNAQGAIRDAFHFANGTQNVPMDLGDIQITPSTPYPGEEEQAQMVTDQSVPGQIQKLVDEHSQSKDVLAQIDDALGNKPEESQARNLDGMTLNKDEALKGDKSVEDQYAKEEGKADKDTPKEVVNMPDVEKNDLIDEDSKKLLASNDPDAAKEAATSDKKSKEDGPSARLKNAQDAERNSILFNQLGKISDKMGASMGNFQAQNQSIYDEGIKNADLPVKNLEQQIAMEKFDPNSKTSQAFRQYLQKFGGDEVKDLGNISAADAASIAPMAFKQFEAQQAQEAKAMDLAARNQERLAQTQMQVEQRREAAQQHNDMMRLMLENKNQAAKDKKSQQDAEKQNKIFTSTGQLLEQMRGSPAVSQAEKDIYAAQKADSLANLYPDPNNLNPQQVRLLATEISKIASGGAPTMEELKGVTPDTFRGKLAGVVQKFTNSPSPANAADFIKQYQDYTKALTKDAQKVILDRYSRIIKPRKDLMSSDQYDMLNDQYINRFNDAVKSPTSPQDNAGKTVVKKGYNPQTNKTQLIYSDGTKEIVDGKQ